MKIFCNREYKQNRDDTNTLELEKTIKQKLNPIQKKLDEKINQLISECEKEHNILIVVHYEDRKVHTVFSVDTDNFKI